MAKLTALQAKAISEPGRHGDGDGLYLNVAAAGSKSWVQRIVIEGRRRDIGLGSFPTISLAQAPRFGGRQPGRRSRGPQSAG